MKLKIQPKEKEKPQLRFLKEIDYLILYAIYTTRNNRADLQIISSVIAPAYSKIYNKPRLPTYSYFYKHLERLREHHFITKEYNTYRIHKDIYERLKEFVLSYIKLEYGLE